MRLVLIIGRLLLAGAGGVPAGAEFGTDGGGAGIAVPGAVSVGAAGTVALFGAGGATVGGVVTTIGFNGGGLTAICAGGWSFALKIGQSIASTIITARAAPEPT
jgi:hypothetical protein